MKRTLALSLGLLVLITAPRGAVAGGYDTPILYSARHIGMGGTSIGYVYDPTAIFSNPAGLGHTDFISLTVDFSPLMGSIQASPASPYQNIDSDFVFAPAFLVGAAFRVHKYVTLGVGAYPVAAAGAKYTYTKENSDTETTDETNLRFIEVSPAITFNIPGNVRLGLGYRISIIQLKRFQETVDKVFDFDLTGVNFAGFRAGLQWSPSDDFEIGLVYRHKTETTAKTDTGIVLTNPQTDVELDVILPSKLGIGMRKEFGALAVALDLEWTFNSQNEVNNLRASPAPTFDKDGNPALDKDGNRKMSSDLSDPGIPVFSRWHDALTARIGLEYTIAGKWAARLGYIFDGATSNLHYPSAFGTPPTATHSFTVGAGYKTEDWELNVAYAHRTGSLDITPDDVHKDNKDPSDGLLGCLTCSDAGRYEMNLHGAYLDFSWYWH